MQLSPPAFNRFLNRIGQNISWESANLCPCRDPRSESAQPDCPKCKGKGVFWGDPQNAVIGLAGQRTQRHWAQMGGYEQGDVVITIPSDTAAYPMSALDRITFVESDIGFALTLRRSINDIPFPVRFATIEKIFWFDTDGESMILGDNPSIDENNALVWQDSASTVPNAGVQYSIQGRAKPIYFVAPFDLPQDREHHHGAPLPRRVVLRKWDLYGR